jgi:hypothetical protein
MSVIAFVGHQLLLRRLLLTTFADFVLPTPAPLLGRHRTVFQESLCPFELTLGIELAQQRQQKPLSAPIGRLRAKVPPADRWRAVQAGHAGSRLYTDSAGSYRALKGYIHEFVNHTQKEYARGDVHENRAECLFSLLQLYLRVFLWYQ